MIGTRKVLGIKTASIFPCNFEECLELKLANVYHRDHICGSLGEKQPQTLAGTTVWSLLGGHRSEQNKQELG